MVGTGAEEVKPPLLFILDVPSIGEVKRGEFTLFGEETERPSKKEDENN